MSSHASVDVMIELEDRFEIEFPTDMLNRRVFGSIAGSAVRTTGVDEHATRRKDAASRDRRVDRVARGGDEHEVGHPLKVVPLLVAGASAV
jgi:hypothetical protein